MFRSLSRALGLSRLQNSPSRPKARPSLAVEALEDRRVPATLQLLNGVMTYTAGAAVANNLSVALNGATYTFQDTAETITVLGVPGATGSGTNTVSIPAAQVQAAGLRLNLGDRDDTLAIGSTANVIQVLAGTGNDRTSLGSPTNSLAGIAALVTVHGQGGSDAVVLNDQGNGSGNDYLITATDVSRNAQKVLSYATMENLTVNGGSGPIIFFGGSTSNRFTVRSTSAATTLNAGSSFEEIAVGNIANSLDEVRGALTVNNGGRLILNDHGDANANSYTVTSTQVTRVGSAPITYKVAFNTGLTLNAGAFNDTVAVKSTSAETVLNLGAGNDSVTLGSGSALTSSLGGIGFVTIRGQGGADAVVLNETDAGVVRTAGQAYRITSAGVSSRNFRFQLRYDTIESLDIRAGSGPDTFTFLSTAATTPVTVRAGLGNDTFKMGSSTEFVTNATNFLGAITLDGQGATDTLDYSAFKVGVRVNLAAGTATGVAGGISNIENVTGGSANDILVGNDLVNVLRGGPGRDILIGRGGADRLFGEAGEDILIGSATVHDLNAAALENVMREWGRTDLIGTTQSQYAARILHLIGLGTGLNGATRLNLSQVVDDGVADTLDGGTELDWFFKLGADVIAAVASAERVN